MPKLRRLSASEAVAIFQQFGFAILSQRGSHIKLRRINQSGEKVQPDADIIPSSRAKELLAEDAS